MKLTEKQVSDLITAIVCRKDKKKSIGELAKIFPLYFILEHNQLLKNYVKSSSIAINNFLTYGIEGYKEESAVDFENFPKKGKNIIYINDSIENFKNRIKNEVQNGQLKYYNIKYLPVCPLYIKFLIELDEIFRLSKYWTKPISLYRATFPLKDAQMLRINSFSSDITCVLTNYFLKDNGTVFKCDLPAHFPRIKKTSTRITEFPMEKEVLLPPCEFETTKIIDKLRVKRENNKNLKYMDTQYEMELKVRPLSLAKVFLERMKNPPKDYPNFFLEDPAFEYEKAMQILEDYVENYVDKKIIEVNGEIVPEHPDPEIVFESEEYEKNN